jgi:hypothetical protein
VGTVVTFSLETKFTVRLWSIEFFKKQFWTECPDFKQNVHWFKFRELSATGLLAKAATLLFIRGFAELQSFCTCPNRLHLKHVTADLALDCLCKAGSTMNAKPTPS